MLGLFPHMRYREWYAIGELVDNSLQSWISNRLRLREVDGPGYRLQIHITVDPSDGGLITIRDNAAGIAGKDWGRAFQVAEPPSDATGLSQFGVGMKAASCWFARRWSLRTSALGEPLEREVQFDVPAILAEGTEELVVHETVASTSDHWTELRLWDLHRVPRGRTIGKIKEHLASIYRTFLRSGDVVITYNGVPLEFEEHPVLVAPYFASPDGDSVKWIKDVEVALESGRRVTGWVAIRETGRQREVGLALLYRGKVVTGAGEDLYKPSAIFGSGNSFESQRLFGELDMSDFAVTYTKDNLVWFDEEDDVIEALKRLLETEPMPILKQAQGYRARKPEEAPRAQLDAVADRTSQLLRDAGDIGDLWFSADAAWPSPDSTLDVDLGDVRVPALVNRSLELVHDGVTWTADLELVDEPAVQEWLTVLRAAESVAPRVSVKVNSAHPFMRAFCEMPAQELEPVWRVAVAIGIAQEVARSRGAKFPNYVTQAVNALVRVLAAQPV
ncbi:ATP-binding protein [Cellulomonas sp. URHD0024]|uniref:ATP-binding protein n=1 Tax=Cellulomonas sp. URHD0024 TaxID=1302620 RepID=UPI0006861569|nr:ATP-binding protein [Cellulomonas sp. URHD0024]